MNKKRIVASKKGYSREEEVRSFGKKQMEKLLKKGFIYPLLQKV